MTQQEKKKWIITNWNSLIERKKLSDALNKYWGNDIVVFTEKLFNT